MMNIISLEKLFATFDAVIGLGWSELSEDDYIRYLKDYSIILEDDGCVSCSEQWLFLQDRRERYDKMRSWIKQQRICDDVLRVLGDGAMSEQELCNSLSQQYDEDELLQALTWMDTLNLLTIHEGKYAVYDDEDDPADDADTMTTYSNIELQEDKYSIYEYLRKVRHNAIELNPDFQRSSVWTPKQQSRFIESAILGIPLPPIYLKRDSKKGLLMVDGLQRTTCLRAFFNNEFALTGLKTLTDLNDCTMDQLRNEHQDMATRLEDKQMYVYILSVSVRMKVVYDIFDRINTGGTQLTRQEIRNCIYTGASTRLLKDLALTNVFKNSIDNGIKPLRMKDREAVLRCLAFSILGYKKYAGSMDEYLVKTMQQLNECSKEQIEVYKNRALRVFEETLELFGKKNFRLPSNNTRGRVTIAVMETVFYNFWHHELPLTLEEKQALSGYMEALIGNDTYHDAVRWSTSTKTQVDNRFEKAIEIFKSKISAI